MDSRLETLANFPEGQQGEIAGLPEHCLLAPLGLRRGKQLQVIVRQPLGGPIIVEVGGRQIAISRRIAGQIKIKGI